MRIFVKAQNTGRLWEHGVDENESERNEIFSWMNEKRWTRARLLHELALNNARTCKARPESKVETSGDGEDIPFSRLTLNKGEVHVIGSVSHMLFVGAPLGARSVKGGMGMPVVDFRSFSFAFGCWALQGKNFSKDGFLPPEIGMWMGWFLSSDWDLAHEKSKRLIRQCSTAMDCLVVSAIFSIIENWSEEKKLAGTWSRESWSVNEKDWRGNEKFPQ